MTKKTKIDWMKIKHDYLFKNIPLKKLADKYGVSYSQVFKHSKDEEWVRLRDEKRREIGVETEQKLTEKEIARKVAKNEKHIELYEDGIEIIEGLLKLYKEKLALSNANRVKVSADALEKVLSCIEKAQKGQRLALNMEKEAPTNEEPKLVMVENLDLNKL